jgi:Tol biopolymer transport system component
MLRWAAGAALLIVFLSASAAAVAADSPRLLVFNVDASSEAIDLVTVSPGRPGERSLLMGRPGLRRGLLPGDVPSWSPDGRLVAFSSKRNIWVVGADGHPRRLPGTRGGYYPVFSPDGRTLAFARTKSVKEEGRRYPSFESTAVWTVDLETGEQRRLTRLRNGLEQLPASFSPDGSTLLVTRFSLNRSFDFELVAIRFDGRTSSLLVGRGGFGRYSPDGSRIVFMKPDKSGNQAWDLYTVDARGDDLRRLTHTPRGEELDPSWDPSGRRVVYTLATVNRRGRIETAAIWQMNRDGSCPSVALSQSGHWYFAPSFQPSLGGASAPLSC